MEIKQYQEELKDTVTYGNSHRIIYPTLALNSEVHGLGEIVKNVFQSETKTVDKESKEHLTTKLANCLWCIISLANDLDIDLDQVAQDNLKGSKEIYDTFISKN